MVITQPEQGGGWRASGWGSDESGPQAACGPAMPQRSPLSVDTTARLPCAGVTASTPVSPATRRSTLLDPSLKPFLTASFALSVNPLPQTSLLPGPSLATLQLCHHLQGWSLPRSPSVCLSHQLFRPTGRLKVGHSPRPTALGDQSPKQHVPGLSRLQCWSRSFLQMKGPPR